MAQQKSPAGAGYALAAIQVAPARLDKVRDTTDPAFCARFAEAQSLFLLGSVESSSVVAGPTGKTCQSVIINHDKATRSRVTPVREARGDWGITCTYDA